MITLATQTVTGAFSSGGFVEVDATNMPGVYRLDLPDAVCATGVNSVVVMLKGAANMAPVTLEIQLVSYDPNDSAALGLTLVPANVTQLNGVAQSLLDLKDFADDGYDPATNKVTGVVLVDTITTYTGNTPQTGDSFARLGAPAGASVSADIAGVQSDTNDIQTRLPAALVSGRIDCSVGAMAASVLTSTAIAAGAFNNSKFASDYPHKGILTGTCQAGSTASNIVLSTAASATNNFYDKCHVQTTGGTGAGQQRHMENYNGTTKTADVYPNWITTPDATTTFAVVGEASVWSEPRSANANSGSFGEGVASVQGNVTGSVGSVTGAVGSVTGAVGSVTAAVTVGTNNDKTGYALSAAGNVAVMTAQMTESYNADGTAPTPAQAFFVIMQSLTEISFSATTGTVKKLDGTTTALTLTINSATDPTSITRAT